MIKQPLALIFERDLNKLKEEINLYKEESNLWKIEKNISNSAGNLALHLIGNLNHFIGAVLGNTGYVRERDKEFSSVNIPRELIIQNIDATIIMVKNVLLNLSDEALTINFLKKNKDRNIQPVLFYYTYWPI
jgi:hypothetical protein